MGLLLLLVCVLLVWMLVLVLVLLLIRVGAYVGDGSCACFLCGCAGVACGRSLLLQGLHGVKVVTRQV